jgi:hypothetical protein
MARFAMKLFGIAIRFQTAFEFSEAAFGAHSQRASLEKIRRTMRILYGKGRSALRILRREDVWNEEFSTENGQKFHVAPRKCWAEYLKTKAHQERDGEESENETKSE